MTQRLNYFQQSPELVKPYMALAAALKSSAIEETIRSLVEIRASQMNGCAFCVDMHIKQARIHGERELRLHHVAVWRESPLFSARERACLEWTEVLTKLPEHGVSDDIYSRVRAELSEKDISDLTFQVMAINSWNRANVAFQTVPGSADAQFGLTAAGLN
jgi:AhpD family alkylhydroperoxidase